MTDRLKKQGIKQVYFMIISSSFSGDHDDVIRSLKMDTDVREVLLVEAGALVALLEAKLRDPLLTLGPVGVQRLLANSGILSEADVREFKVWYKGDRGELRVEGVISGDARREYWSGF